VPEEILFQITPADADRMSNMEKLIEYGGLLPPYVKKARVDNLKRLIARMDKIVEAMRIKTARQIVQTLSYFGRSRRRCTLDL